MFDKIKTFYGTSKPVPPLQCGPKERDRLYRRLRFQSFLAGTVSYSLYYVCRTTLNVVKKPIIDMRWMRSSWASSAPRCSSPMPPESS